MSKVLVVLTLSIVMSLVYLFWNHADYGSQVPPGFPADIPVVDGDIISGRRTLFEDGRGYVLDIRTDLSRAEVVRFYTDSVGEEWIVAAPGMPAGLSSKEFLIGRKKILLETHAGQDQTFVTLAVHLDTWW